MKVCPVCSKKFEPKSPKQVFCSDACKMKNARSKKKPQATPKKKSNVDVIAPSREVKVKDLPAPKKLEVVFDNPKKIAPLDDEPFQSGLSKAQLEIRKKKLGF